ncbi:MAG: VCBS repeat-containing protein, partial [Candidatus Marinimicrobia bacterium]|nr:VCBS repeat-containing protein [Candidatus Neomarinimicrobiota bacterium]
MRKVLILMLVFAAFGFAAQTNAEGDVLLASPYKVNTMAAVAAGIEGFDVGAKLSAEVIRDLWVGSDFDGDGNKEVMLASYSTSGRAYVYEIDGDNSATLFFDTGEMGGGYSSSTRHVAYGDLDGNGMQELLVSVNATDDTKGGIWAYEYDTVGDSMRAPVQLFKALVTADRWYCENFTVGDVDQDGVEEIFFGNNGASSANDNFYIASVDSGSFAEGYIRTVIEFTHGKSSSTFPIGGSPYGGVIADLNGDGMNEVLFAPWDHGAMLIVENDSADSYTAVNYIQTDLDREDDFAFWDFLPYDLDGDGRDEAYLSMYSAGRLYVTTCPEGTALADMTTANVHTIDDQGASGGVA